MGYLLVAALVFIADQGSKLLVRGQMVPGQEIVLINRLLSLKYVNNAGAAFGVLSGKGGLLRFLPIAVIVAIVVIILLNKYMHPFCKYALVLIAMGGIGNLVDRLMFGQVTDMIYVHFFPAIFNVADIAVTVGCAMLLLYVLFGERFAHSRRKRG